MSGYTIKNLMDIDDAAKARREAAVMAAVPDIQARVARSHLDSAHLGLTHMEYGPDTRTPFGHSHREQEEVCVVLSGSGHAKLDDELVIAGSDRPPDGDGVPGPADFWPA